MSDFAIKSTGNLIAKATAFRNFDPVLKRELSKRIRQATEPLKAEIAASALAKLPKAGGLAQLIAESKTTTTVTLAGNKTGVRLRTRSPRSIKTIDQGKVRHPVYGNRKVWVDEDVKPDFWTEPVEKSKPEITAAVNTAVHSVLEEIRTA